MKNAEIKNEYFNDERTPKEYFVNNKMTKNSSFQ
jgi:hypothetical protein